MSGDNGGINDEAVRVAVRVRELYDLGRHELVRLRMQDRTMVVEGKGVGVGVVGSGGVRHVVRVMNDKGERGTVIKCVRERKGVDEGAGGGDNGVRLLVVRWYTHSKRGGSGKITVYRGVCTEVSEDGAVGAGGAGVLLGVWWCAEVVGFRVSAGVVVSRGVEWGGNMGDNVRGSYDGWLRVSEKGVVHNC